MTLLDEILAEIDRDGPIPFSRYMELALYHPTSGFYAAGGAGRRRDFITSPEVGPLFGAVLARAIDHWWDELGQPDRFTFVEAGAGPGTLARTVLRSPLRCRDALAYVTVESSGAQRELHPEGVTPLEVMPDDVGVGVVFANELLDNLPFDLLWTGGSGWREVRIGADGRALHEVVVESVSATTNTGPAPGEMRVPRQTAAASWLRHALATLQRGRVVVVDYAVASYPTDPTREWLRTYSDQGRGGDPLDAPGTKDITADVDISQLAAVASIEALHGQADWLRRMGVDELVAEGRQYWNEHRSAPDLKAFEMQSRSTESAALLDPAGLGGFTVIEWAVDRG